MRHSEITSSSGSWARLSTAPLLMTAVGLAMGCGGAAKSQGDATDVELLVLDAEPAQQSFDKIVLSLPWELVNPTAEKAGIGKAKWTLEIEGEAPLQGEQIIDASVPAGQRHRGTLSLESGLDTSSTGFAAREDKPGLRYTAKVTFTVSSGQGEEPFEAEWFGEVFPTRKPAVTLRAEGGRFGDDMFELNFLIGVSNPNPFPVTVGILDYTLFVNDVEIAQGKLAAGAELQPSSELQYDVQRFIGRDDLPELAEQLKKMETIPYRMAATLVVRDIEIDSPITGEIAFAR